jgi:hypothetical protein
MIIYDEEVYPNLFLTNVLNEQTEEHMSFVCSEDRNDWPLLRQWMHHWCDTRVRMCGFNNDGYDYPILHKLLTFDLSELSGLQIAELAYRFSTDIIETPWNDRFRHKVWATDQVVRQTDLYLLNHFDNPARATGLKQLEFNLHMMNVQELPFHPGTVLNAEERAITVDYCWNDIRATKAFKDDCQKAIDFREHLSHEYKQDFSNASDAKIGSSIIVKRLEDEGIPCYEYVNKKRKPRQTKRGVIHLRDVIFPYVSFSTPEFQQFLTHLQTVSIKDTRKAPEMDGLNVVLSGFQFDFGTGGIHGSIDSELVESTDDRMILDIDVTSFYPSLAIVNRLYPEHLGEQFCDIYEAIKQERVGYAKGTPQNAALKIALNATYGNSNNQYSPLMDPKFTMAITINGQLLLCMLAEALITRLPGLRMLQANTDGITVEFDRTDEQQVRELCDQWCQYTKLDLEFVEYQVMAIRDVNNYLAVSTDGKVKRKGAYDWDKEHHQDQSFLVVPKVVEKVLVENVPIGETLRNWPDIFDFMGRTKVPKSGRLMVSNDSEEWQEQNVTRYYVTTDGVTLTKILPPLKGKTEERKFAIQKGRKVAIANNLWRADWLGLIDYDYYQNEVEKLVLGLG